MSNVDTNLLARAVDGDVDALSALLERHGPLVEQSLRIERNWRRQIDAADVMQVTYVEAFRHIREFEVKRADRFEAWLRQIAENNLRDAVRGLSRVKRGGAEQHQSNAGNSTRDETWLLNFAGTSSTPSLAARRNEAAERIEQALRRLPPDYARAVRLLDVQGQAVAAVAAEMGRSPGAIHMLRARAHDRLRELLGPESAFLTSS